MEYTLDELKEIWKDKINGFRDKDIFCLYIDNPFCIKKCKFCIYSPTETKIGSDLYKKYYTEMLPGEIEKFKEILNLRVPDSIYFGGGTASLMTEEIMEDIFSKIPNFKEIKNKVFENHPAMLTKRKIDIFAKYNFTYLSFGIQSFNKEIILGQNRIPFNINKVQELIQYAKEKGMKVNCDLLAFMETGELEDLVQLEKDLYTMVETLKPDIITLFPMYQRLHLEFDSDDNLIYSAEEQKEKNYKLILKLRRIILKFIRNNKSGYNLYSKDTMTLEKEQIIKDAKWNYFITTLTNEEFDEMKVYSSSGYPHQPAYQNTLAFGGYGSRRPYSYIGKKMIYENIFDNTYKYIDKVN